MSTSSASKSSVAPAAAAWRPTARIEHLRLRAAVLARIRRFFAERSVLEVETPVLGGAGVTEPALGNLLCRYEGPGAPEGRTLYLQTSPEAAMKRLLAAGSGPIFQIARVFRDGEAGRLHNPEFTLLEWYRPGWDHHALMDEVEELVRSVLDRPAARRIGYGEAFLETVGLDPHRASAAELARCARRRGLAPVGLDEAERDGWLDALLVERVVPALGPGLVFLFDFPASQAALARVRPGDPPVAERFELYVDGIELANGFHELADPVEQRRRFERDRARRRERGLPDVAPDERLLAALEAGLPESAGVALGVDRLVLLAAGAERLSDVIAFAFDRA